MSEKQEGLKCSTCSEPTRKIKAFADGHTLDGKPYHRVICSCDNTDCALKVIMDTLEEERREKRQAARQENQKNGIKASDLMAMRMKTGMLLYDASRLLGVTVVQLSQWENEIASVPPEVFNQARVLYRRVYRERMVNRG